MAIDRCLSNIVYFRANKSDASCRISLIVSTLIDIFLLTAPEVVFKGLTFPLHFVHFLDNESFWV